MSFLKICSPQVVHETVDGEVVVVHLEKGLYFSIDAVGAHVWSLVEQGLPRASIVEQTAEHYPSAGDVAAEINAFLASLIEHELVVDVAEAPAAIPESQSLELPGTYVTPQLLVYSDMEDLLLLDPIHDVEEEQGWPNVG